MILKRLNRFNILKIIFFAFFSLFAVTLLNAADGVSDIFYKQGMAQIEENHLEDALKSLKSALEIKKGNYIYARWLMFVSFRLGLNALFAGDHSNALNYFSYSLEMKKLLTAEKDEEYVTIERFIELIPEHEKYSKAQPEYVFKFQVLYIRNTDMKDTFGKDGKPVTGKATMDDAVISRTAIALNTLKFYVETLSKGRLSLSFEKTIVETTLTRATIYGGDEKSTVFRPDFNSTADSLGTILFAGRNQFDAIFYYFLTPNFRVWPYSRYVEPIWVPYTWYGPFKNSIEMPFDDPALDDGGVLKNSSSIRTITHDFVLFHEFFHIVENKCGEIVPQHAHLPENINQAKKNFPEWVPDMNPAWTATEYTWYRYHFLNTVPKCMELKAASSGIYPPFLNFSNTNSPDKTPDYLFKTYTETIKGITLDNLRLAEESYHKGWDLAKDKKPDEAKLEYEKALKYNPYHFKSLLELAAIAFKSKGYAEAFKYYDAYGRLYPDVNFLFNIAMKFHDANEHAKAANFFRIASEQPGANPVYYLWLARSLTASGDDQAAKAAMEKLASNPLMKYSPLLISSKKAGLSLNTNINPMDEGSPILAWKRKGEALSWRIVPSEKEGYVYIVSDYNWKCIAVTDRKGTNVIVMEDMKNSDNQKWKLEEVSKGLFRIVSYSSGMALAIEIIDDWEKKLLVLQSPGNDPLQVWNLEAAFVRIVNRLTHCALYEENGVLLCDQGAKQNDIWMFEKVQDDKNSFVRILNFQTGHGLHIQNLKQSVECTEFGKGWWSAQWALSGADNDSIYITNRWKPQKIVLGEEKKVLHPSDNPQKIEQSQWLVEEVKS